MSDSSICSPGSSSSLLSGSRSAKASDNKSAAAAPAASQKSKSSRQPPPRRAANKRRRPSDEEELSEEEENSDEEEGLRSNGAKLYVSFSRLCFSSSPSHTVTRPVQTAVDKRGNASSETRMKNAECAGSAIFHVYSNVAQSESSQCEFLRRLSNRYASLTLI